MKTKVTLVILLALMLLEVLLSVLEGLVFIFLVKGV